MIFFSLNLLKLFLYNPQIQSIFTLSSPYPHSFFVYSPFILHLPVRLAPSFVRSLFVHCSSFVRSLFVHCSFIVRSLFVHCSFIVRLLFVLCSFFVRSLFVHCSSFVRSLFVHCSFIVRSLFVFCSSFVRLFIICLSCYDCPCGSHLPMRLAHLLICQLFPIFAP